MSPNISATHPSSSIMTKKLQLVNQGLKEYRRKFANSDGSKPLPIKTKPSSPVRGELTGAEAIEVDTLIIKLNEMLLKCDEILAKYKDELNLENEELLDQIKEEISITRDFIVDQDNLLIVLNGIKKLSETVDKLQIDSFNRQKHTILEYLEALKEALTLVDQITEIVKETIQADIYSRHVATFLRTVEEQVAVFETQAFTKKMLEKEKYDHNDLKSRVNTLLAIFKESILTDEKKYEDDMVQEPAAEKQPSTYKPKNLILRPPPPVRRPPLRKKPTAEKK